MNRQVILQSRPRGGAQAENFAVVDSPLYPLAPGEVRIGNRYLSVEPAMRGWIADTGNYADPIALGSVMKALAVGEVVETTDPAWRTGDWVTGWFGRQEFASVRSEAILHHLREDDLPPSLALGALGINGVTALLCLTQWGARRTAALCRGHAGGAGGLP